MLPEKTHEYFMKQALMQAGRAFDEGEVPVGAVVVCKGQVIGKGYNQVERLGDATAHAEMLAITAASDYMNSKYLKQCTLYVTVEPCFMCGGAAHWSQVGKIIYGTPDPRMGLYSNSNHLLNSKVEVIEGIMAEEALALMQQFFENLRSD